MVDETFLLDTADGARVVVHRWEPDGGVRGVLVVAHGLAEHAGRYGRLAGILGEAGFAVYAPDHRGHGESAETLEDLGWFAAERGWVKILDDLHRVALRARKEHPDVPLIVMGQSMGSLLVQQYLFTFADEIDGAVLLASNGPDRLFAAAGAIPARLERRRLGPRGRSALLDRLVFGAYNRAFRPNRTKFDWLSRDEVEVDAYLADPRCGFVPTTQLFLDLSAGVGVIGDVRNVRAVARPELPVYIASGSRDPMGGARGIGRLLDHYASAGLTDVTHRIYPGARHEILNERNRDEVVADLLAWLERR